jgi:hypothetical protein
LRGGKQIRVRRKNGEIILLNIEINDTVSQVKEMIRTVINVHPNQQRLLLNQIELENYRRLSDYTITSDIVLKVIVLTLVISDTENKEIVVSVEVDSCTRTIGWVKQQIEKNDEGEHL